jgi:N-acetylneuraminic acid mutarotase
MPAALGAMAIGLWNGIVYVAGGSPDLGASVVNTLYAYDIAANTWSTLASMPQASWASGFGAIHGKLYVAGGSDSVTPLNTLYIYDIRSNTWTTGANLPATAEAPGSAVLQNKLYVFGHPAADHNASLQPWQRYLEPWTEHERLPMAVLRDSSGQ